MLLAMMIIMRCCLCLCFSVASAWQDNRVSHDTFHWHYRLMQPSTAAADMGRCIHGIPPRGSDDVFRRTWQRNSR
jgi:hypothetical protein